MKTDKIKDAMLDLQNQKIVLEKAIEGLQAVLNGLNGHSESGNAAIVKQGHYVISPADSIRGIDPELSYIDSAIQFIKVSGRPMHIRKLVEQIQVLRHNPNIKRSSIEATIVRHIAAKGEDARIIRIRPGIYSVPNLPSVSRSVAS